MKREILSYPLAKILVSLTKKRNMMENYAKAEAELALKFMRREEGDTVMKLAEEIGLKVENGKIHAFAYLKYLPKGNEWKLLKMNLEGGFVRLDEEGLRRVISEKLRQDILSDLPVPLENAPKLFIFFADELSSSKEIERTGRVHVDLGPVDVEAFPPCIRNIYAAAKSGESLPHEARFVLATFLSNIGFGTEEIVDLFRTVPNFNERKTRYYIQYIIGKRGSKTKYTAAACAKLETYGLCRGKDRLCKDIKSPLSYYARRKKWGKSTSGKKSGNITGAE
jgi:DNA primase large subunit